MSDDRIPMPERPEPKKFNAPLWAGAVVAVGLIVVLLVNVFGHKDKLTVAELTPPAVAALDGGSEVYPANSEGAFTEDVKFGYLPAPTLTSLDDGTIVAADPETTAETMGLPDGLGGLSVEEFRKQTIRPPRQDTQAGTPITWNDLVDDASGSTVLVPFISDMTVADRALAKITEADMADSTIVRTADAQVAKAAQDAGIDAMFVGDYSSAGPDELIASGYTMIAVPAEAVPTWGETDLNVWVTDVKDKKQLDDLAKQGIMGALSTNPYEVLPSTVKTN